MKKTTSLISKAVKCLLVLGILFSQLSFPLNVLADEVLEQDEVETINQEEQIQDEITTTDNIDSEKQEENNTQVENTPGGEIVEEIGENPIIEVYSVNDYYFIRCMKEKEITLKHLKEKLENIIKVITKDEIELSDEEQVFSEYTVTLNNEETESSYTLVILGDYNLDGKVTSEDQEVLLQQLKTGIAEDKIEEELPFVDLNNDGNFDILDVTHSIYHENGNWENENEAKDELENYLTRSKVETYIGETIDINYVIEGFNEDSLSGINGNLTYDKTLLELTKVLVNGTEIAITDFENGNFAYLLEDYNSNDNLITFTFKTLKEGTAIVTIDNIVASVKGIKAKLDTNEVSTSFEVYIGKGGDEEELPEETLPEEVLPEETPKEEIKEEPTEEKVEIPTQTVYKKAPVLTKPVVLSNDNTIKSLIIKGYDIEFDQNTYEYSIKVKNKVSALDLTVILNNEKATYTVEGNEKFKAGENIVNITVTAENGETKTYTIKVNKEKEKNTEDEEETNKSSKTVIIILIILVIIGLIYVIFKDDEEEQQETKKQQTKGSKKK